jgi:Zn finger protein HypA/HybF involved in hydrogenase expression
MKRIPHNKLTIEQVLEQFKEVHGDQFDYSNVVYVDTHTKVEIYCKKHSYTFHQIPKDHKKGMKCYFCGRESQIEKAKKNQEQFIQEVIELHGDKYDLSLVNYINSKTPVKLICKERGVIEAQPSSLLDRRRYLAKDRRKTKSTNKNKFIEEATKIYGDKDNYEKTNIISSKEKIEITCTKHDRTFEKSIQTYLAGYGCPMCSAENYSQIRTKSTEDFIKQSKEIHGDSCDYTNTVYKSCRDKVTIKCNKHNTYFETVPSNHIAGGKCRKCLSENISNSLKGKEGTCGYNKSGYIKQANGRQAYIYLIRCWNDEEEFYKIGKTFLDINKRFTKGNICYNFEKVSFYNGDSGYIYDLENELHRKYKAFKYNPNNKFAGYTECYDLTLPTEEIINLGNE